MEKDVTRIAVERAAKRLRAVRNIIKDQILTTGPFRVRLNPAEFRAAFEKMSPEQRSRTQQLIPEEDLTRVLLGSGGNR